MKAEDGEHWAEAEAGPRRSATTLWTGTEMIVWGGFDGEGYLSDTWSCIPGKTMYLYLKP